jgi:hydrogenase/urease accessory protein HupE
MTAFLGGLIQFFIPTHLLAVVALGLLAGQHARPTRADMPGMLIVGLVIGSTAIALAMRETPAASALLLLAALAASVVVVGRPTPPSIGVLLAFAIGVALPLNAPPHEITIPAAIAAQIGFAVAALAALALVTVVAMQATRSWQRVGVRIVGSWIAASAILVLALRLAR